MHEGMLPWQGNPVPGDTSCADENLPIMMKTSKRVLKFIKVGICDEVASCDVTKVQKCRETFDHLGRYMTRNCTKIDLGSVNQTSTTQIKDMQTFISALESSPVHCRK